MCAHINAGTRAKLSFKLTILRFLLVLLTPLAISTKEMHIRIYPTLLGLFVTAGSSLQRLVARRRRAEDRPSQKRKQRGGLPKSKAEFTGWERMKIFLNSDIKISCIFMLGVKGFLPMRKLLLRSSQIGPEASHTASMSLFSVL